MSDDLKGFAARKSARPGAKLRVLRIARQTLPEIFDLKDALVRACLDGQISEDERAVLRAKLRAVGAALEVAILEEVTR